jgi:hypothetical protein
MEFQKSVLAFLKIMSIISKTNDFDVVKYMVAKFKNRKGYRKWKMHLLFCVD